MDADEVISVNVRVNFVTRLIELTKFESEDPSSIVTKIFDAFQLDASEYITFHFTNNHHAPITVEQLPRLIAQHKNSGCFYIVVILDQPTLCLRAEGIRNHLIDSGYGRILEEYQLIGDLSKKSCKMLTDGMINYLTETLPNIRDATGVTEACNAMISLFPLLSIDDFYNVKTKKGTIFHRIKNMPKAKNYERPIENEAELIDFLKQCVVANDKQMLKSKLGETITLRQKLLRQNTDDYADFMAFYFTDPELILYDFGLFFPSIDFKALHNMWDQLLITPISDWKENVDVSAVPAKDENIWKLFILFNKFKNARSRFYTNIKSLIVFSTSPSDDPMQLMNSKNRNPYIIAVLSSNGKSAKYYIHVHRHLVSAPGTFAFVDAVDLLYKIHKVFDLQFNPQIKHFMDFLDCFVYQDQFDDDSITPTMRKVAHDLLKVPIE